VNLYNLKRYKKKFYCTFIPFFISILFITSFQNSFSQENNSILLKPQKIFKPKEAEGMNISSITIEGNSRTSDDVIKNSIELRVGQSFSQEKLKNSLQSLKNLRVFSSIDIQILSNPENNLKVDLIVNIDEKWTILPYFLIGSGGGTSYFILGFYDTNFIGRLYTFNFTYGCKNDNCSTYLYFRNPSVLGSAFNLVNYLIKEHNVYQIYDHNRNIVGAFSNKKNMIYAFTDIKINPSFFLGLGFLYLNNTITSDGISDADIYANNLYNYISPVSTSSVALEGRLTLGKIDYEGMKADGVNFISILDTTGQSYSESADNYSSLNSTLLYYNSKINLGLFTIPLPKLSYLALRGNISVTSSDVASQQFFVGGLDKIRGFYDGEFSGKYSWFSNVELRIPSYVSNNIAFQHALFTDAGYAADTIPNVFNQYTGVSIGTGIRILPLKINRVAIRFDFAYTLNPFHTFGFNFGLLQFF
jgi:outer membrane protein assembly factor BamA